MLWLVGAMCLLAYVQGDTKTCMSDLAGGKHTLGASTQSTADPASAAFTGGWCASSKNKTQWLDVEFPSDVGVKSVNIAPQDGQSTSYPKDVLVKYIPIGGKDLQDFPVQGGLAVITNKPANLTTNFNAGIAMHKLRFLLRDFEGNACMKIGLKGCPLNELCPTCVQGSCVSENNCQCDQGYLGDGCDKIACNPVLLGVGDGRVPSDSISVTSWSPGHTKEDIRLADGKMGWCPAVTDMSPAAVVKLDKPMAVSVLQFTFPIRQEGEEKMYMRTFDLMYIAPQDSTRMYRNYATDIPSINGTHYFTVTLVPPMVTDTVLIKAKTSEKRACFKMDLGGCDPQGLCSPNWCLHGGKCVGDDACSCPNGWVGERCEQKSTDIPVINTVFQQILQNVLITTTFNFTVHGHVTFTLENKVPVLFLDGKNSYIQVKPGTLAIDCLKNINKCTSGFTFAIDVKFEKFVDNTYIISSGGDLPGHHGIALYYSQHTLTYIVTTTTYRWTVQVPYTPVLHTWQHFEITWNKNLGIELHLDGHLLGTVGRPAPVTAGQTLPLCIGCSHTSTQVEISMHIKEFHTWTIDRTELVNAGVKPAPTATPAPVTDSTAASTISTTTATTTPNKGFQEYNLTFLTIVDNLLITPAFNFTLHGHPTLEVQPNGHTAIVLDCSKQQYIELPDTGIPCLEDIDDCSKGFTFRLEVKFTSIEAEKKTYILSSGGDIETTNGMAIYLHSNQLIFGVKQGMHHWSGSHNMTGIIKTQVWYKFEVSWSAAKGINVVIDGFEVIDTNNWTPFPATPKTNPVLIGKTAGSNYTSCMKVRDLYTWTVQREVLVDGGILQNTSTFVQSPTTIKPASTSASSTTIKTTTTSTIRTTTKERDPLVPYDLSFTYKHNNILYTRESAFSFLFHGSPTLSSFPGIQILTLHGLSGDYLQLQNKGMQCIDRFDNCKSGFTVEISLSFLMIDSTKKTNIFSNSGETQGQTGLFLYYLGNNITFGFGNGNRLWKTTFEYKLQTGPYYTFIVSWSENNGIVIYIDYIQIKHIYTFIYVPIVAVPGLFTIGHTFDENTNFGMNIFSIKIWKTASQTLLLNTVFTTKTTTPKPTTEGPTITTPSAKTFTSQAETSNPNFNILATASYDLAFITVNGNQITTPKYTFIAIGHPVLHTLESGKKALELNQSKGEYIRMSNQNVSCLNDLANCSHGFTFQINVNFVQLDYTKKLYIITNSGETHGDGTIYLYYKNHHFYFGTAVGNLRWSAEVKFEVSTNLFQKLELSWSTKTGIQLYVNGKLLKSSNDTTTVDTSAGAGSHISIGKVSENVSSAVLMITDMHFWSVSHQVLETARGHSTYRVTTPATATPISGISPANTTVSDLQTTSHSGAQTIATSDIGLASMATSTNTAENKVPEIKIEHGTTLTTTPKPTTDNQIITTSGAQTFTSQAVTTNPSFNLLATASYDLAFITVNGNQITTPKYTFIAIGHPVLHTLDSGKKALELNQSKGEYIRMSNKNVSCLNDLANCSHGFTFQISVNFVQLDYTKKLYIITNSGETHGDGTIYLYYKNHHFFFGTAVGTLRWSAEVKFEVTTNIFQKLEISWSTKTGIQLYVNGKLLKSSNVSTTVDTFAGAGSRISIGKVSENISATVLMITDMHFWSVSRQVLERANGYSTYSVITPTTASPTSDISPAKTTVSGHQTTSHSGAQTIATSDIGLASMATSTNTVENKVTQTKTEHASTETVTKMTIIQISSSKPVNNEHTTSSPYYSETTTEGSSNVSSETYQFTFLSSTGATIKTTAFTLFTHGSIKIVHMPQNAIAVQLNSTNNEYLELKNNSMFCVKANTLCESFAVKIQLKFLKIDVEAKTYLFGRNSEGPYLYFEKGTFHFGYVTDQVTWSATVKKEIHVNVTHMFELKFSKTGGIILYVDREILKSENKSIQIDGTVETNYTFSIGNVVSKSTTVMLITDFQLQKTSYKSTASMTTQTPTHVSTTFPTRTTFATDSQSKLFEITQKPLHHTSAPSISTEGDSFSSKGHTETVSATVGYNGATQSPSESTPVVTGHIIATNTTILGTKTTESLTKTTARAMNKSTVIVTDSSTVSGTNSNTGSGTTDSTTSSTMTHLTSDTSGACTTEHPLISVKPYNLSFINITGNTLHTQSYTFTVHGSVSLFELTTGEKVIQINSTKGEYVELKNQKIPCINDIDKCNTGVSLIMNINCIHIDYLQRVYIITSNGTTPAGTGLNLYYYNHTLHFGFTLKNESWNGRVKFTIAVNKWYLFELTWSKTFGIGLYVNGILIKASNKSSEVNASVTPVSLLVGKNTGMGFTFLISNILIFPGSRDIWNHSHTSIQHIPSTQEITTTSKLDYSHSEPSGQERSTPVAFTDMSGKTGSASTQKPDQSTRVTTNTGSETSSKPTTDAKISDLTTGKQYNKDTTVSTGNPTTNKYMVTTIQSASTTIKPKPSAGTNTANETSTYSGLTTEKQYSKETTIRTGKTQIATTNTIATTLHSTSAILHPVTSTGRSTATYTKGSLTTGKQNSTETTISTGKSDVATNNNLETTRYNTYTTVKPVSSTATETNSGHTTGTQYSKDTTTSTGKQNMTTTNDMISAPHSNSTTFQPISSTATSTAAGTTINGVLTTGKQHHEETTTRTGNSNMTTNYNMETTLHSTSTISKPRSSTATSIATEANTNSGHTTRTQYSKDTTTSTGKQNMTTTNNMISAPHSKSTTFQPLSSIDTSTAAGITINGVLTTGKQHHEGTTIGTGNPNMTTHNNMETTLHSTSTILKPLSSAATSTAAGTTNNGVLTTGKQHHEGTTIGTGNPNMTTNSNIETTLHSTSTILMPLSSTATSKATETNTNGAHTTPAITGYKTEPSTPPVTAEQIGNLSIVSSTESNIIITTRPQHYTATVMENTLGYSTTAHSLNTNDETTAVTTTKFRETTTKESVPYQKYNLSFVNITEHLIYTHLFAIKTYGFLVLEKGPSGESVVKLNGTKGDYLEINKANISCLVTVDNCTNGFTVQVKVNFLSVNSFRKNYIIVSSGEVSGSTGMYLYYQNNTFHFGTVFQNKTWSAGVNFKITEKTWYTFELTWSVSHGIGLYIDGTLVQSTNVSSSTSTNVPSKPGSILIGKAIGANYTASLLVTGLQFWSASHQIVYQTNAKTTEPLSTTTTTTTTMIPTSTLAPIPTFTWNFTQTTGANITLHGKVPIAGGGLSFTNSTQYIDFSKTNLACLLKPDTCKDGLTIQFTIHFSRLEENTYILTSGGQLPDGNGLAVIYRFNQIQFVLSTSTQSWFATCHRNEVLPNRPHTIMISWHLTFGLEVFVNNVLIDANKNPTTHVATSVSTNYVYFGKQTTVVTSGTSVKVDFVLQTMIVWYARLQILIDRGICKPPTRPTEKPTTKVPATTRPPTTKRPTPVATFSTKSTTMQCPVGCVSIASTVQTPSATQTPKPTPTKKPSATPTKPTRPITPPPPVTATPSTKPTTERGPPNYITRPTLEPIIGNDTKAYLACLFKAAARDVVFTVKLLVDGNVVDQQTSPGNTARVLFAVSKVDMNLNQKKIQCTVRAQYVGGTHTTIRFISNTVIPKFTVSTGHIIVVEGKETKFVTVTSTTPPQFYCCKGCRAQCQVHVVGSFHYNHRKQQKCNNNYIAQSVIVSAKPPNSNSPICGFPLTITNWKQQNKIEIKATIDNRRDGDHTNTMNVIAHVYNQPANAQITVKPSFSFTISSVQVTAKDHDASSTCKSVNDPHMRTFDGLSYNNMEQGVFVLYKHSTLPFEVRALYASCNKRGHATCNCAVAVRSGDDVITVTGCQRTTGGHHGHHGQGHGIGLIMQQLFGGHHNELAKTPMTIQIYKNGDFTPGTIIRRFGCGQKYEIELPTGMIVTVQQSYKPFINIFIRGASSDRGQAEGLCGNFDGSRHNDLHPTTSSFINRWKSEYENFFYGVGVSSQHFISTYCSCIQGKDKICLAGIGAFRCVQTRNDITKSLVKQAKTPTLTRHKRQASTEPTTLPATNIPMDGPVLNETEARVRCTDEITKSDVTNSCTPVLTSNVTDHIDNCVHDYMATYSFEWAKDALRDIAVECIDNINDIRAANESGNTNVTDELPNIPDNIDEILNKSCVDDCGVHGSCNEGVCVCDDGFSGVTCDISKVTVPTTSIVPFLCDMSYTSDCQGAMVFGENFVDTPDLTCHYEFAEVQQSIIPSGETGQVKATLISINQVMCQLPRPQSALLTVSNDGKNPSSNRSAQVVYNSVCQACSVDNQTFKASCLREENSCLIGGLCYASDATREGDRCQVCRPAANDTIWSRSLEEVCQEKPQAIEKEVESESHKKITIALAVVCGVLAAIIVIGAICLIRKSSGASKKPKAEFGSYDISPAPSLYRNELKSADNPTYQGSNDRL